MREAFERPTLRLLDSKWAPMRVAILKSAFSRERRAVHADWLHRQVEAAGSLATAVANEFPGFTPNVDNFSGISSLTVVEVETG